MCDTHKRYRLRKSNGTTPSETTSRNVSNIWNTAKKKPKQNQIRLEKHHKHSTRCTFSGCQLKTMWPSSDLFRNWYVQNAVLRASFETTKIVCAAAAVAAAAFLQFRYLARIRIDWAFQSLSLSIILLFTSFYWISFVCAHSVYALRECPATTTTTTTSYE